ncbi:hypothetical protein DAPPUDRAFT_331943 [Daphnia pulex]|uniref:Uncharacterized protein n=1 Tax=Daphnia pulex TaxID=6669 RepID=E9HNV5_DAPPU|nr:hypothetical protein DAPPUDRAFT_331943 [Daphnia pulex]|eukprot:EFX66565.1 hypothetical protein DAPPUDRAFT_331943 [Daphnia pulex]
MKDESETNSEQKFPESENFYNGSFVCEEDQEILDEDDLLSDGFATDTDYSPEDNESVNLNETELDSALFLAHKAYGSAYGFSGIVLSAFFFQSTRLNRKEFRDKVAVNDAIDTFDDVKEWWKKHQATGQEDVRYLAFKEYKTYEGETLIEKWVPGMFMFQYIKSAVTRGPDEEEVIRPARVETARRVGEEALSSARDRQRSEEMSENQRNNQAAAPTAAAAAPAGAATTTRRTNSTPDSLKSSKEMQLVGGGSIRIHAPRHKEIKQSMEQEKEIIIGYTTLKIRLGQLLQALEWIQLKVGHQYHF